MKSLSTIFAVLSLVVTSQAGIVNNDNTTSEDSIAVTLIALDSIGNPASADSFFVAVFDPHGDSIFGESLTESSPRINSAALTVGNVYTYRNAVSELDGSGLPGCYELAMFAKQSSTGLITSTRAQFQIVPWELSALGDSAGQAARLSQSTYTLQDQTLVSLQTMSNYIAILPDTTEITASVWSARQQDHTESGSFGAFLDAPISGVSGTGSGSYVVDLIAVDSGTGLPLPGVAVTVRNLQQTILFGVGTSNNNGATSFALDPDSYSVTATAPGFVFNSRTVEVNAAATDTLYGSRFDPGQPVIPGLCRVWGYLYTLNGLPEEDVVVTASLNTGALRTDGLLVSPFEVVTETDSTGYFQLDLIPSADFDPERAEYDFSITRTDGTILRRRLEVPSLASWRFAW